MMRRLWPFVLSSVALGLDAYVVAGLLPAVASSLGAREATVGLGVAAFTGSYAVSGPLLAGRAGQRSRRSLVVALLVFTMANLATALSPTVWVFLAAWHSRVWVTYQSGGKYVVNAIPTELGRRQSATNVRYLHVRHLKSLLGAKTNLVTYTIEQQFLCHVALNIFEQGTYNMESWRKGMPWWQQANLVHRCNP